MASAGRSKRAKSPSPVSLITVPPCAVTASPRMRSWRSTAVAMASGCSSHFLVLASMSVNTKVSSELMSGTAAPHVELPGRALLAPTLLSGAVQPLSAIRLPRRGFGS